MKEFFSDINNYLPLITFLVGWLVPNSFLISLGYKLGLKLPKPIIKIINAKLDALQDGLLQAEHEGNKEIVSNEKVKEMIKGTKIDLGLNGVEIKKK